MHVDITRYCLYGGDCEEFGPQSKKPPQAEGKLS
jgi:hypothetical protein